MRIQVRLPSVSVKLEGRPSACPHCGCPILQGWGRPGKKVRDPRREEVEVRRYKCTRCGKTFRHYPQGVTHRQQSQRLRALSVLLYVLGLAYDGASTVLGALGCGLGKTAVYENVQAVGEEAKRLRRKRLQRLRGRVKVAGVDVTAYKCGGEKVLLAVLVSALGDEVLDIELVAEESEEELEEWLADVVELLGLEVLVSDDAGPYKGVADSFGVEHQVCIAHMRKWVKRRIRELRKQSESQGETGEQLSEDLGRVGQLVKELPTEGEKELEELHLRYRRAPPPKRGERASAYYRMRMLTLHLWENWARYRLFKSWEGEVSLDGTNNMSERAIGRSGKVRYRLMRGYKRRASILNVVGLMGWLDSQRPWCDLSQLVA